MQSQNLNQSSLEILNLYLPLNDHEYSPEELLQLNSNLNRILKHQNLKDRKIKKISRRNQFFIGSTF